MSCAVSSPRSCARDRGLSGRVWDLRRPLKGIRPLLCLIFTSVLLSGCLRPAALSEPDRLYPVAEELEPVKVVYDDKGLWANYMASADRTAFRNEIITARMYAIDVNYTEYEVRLTREGAEFDLATALANNGLTTASTLVADPASKSILSGAASFVGFSGTAVNEKLLLKQTIQNIESGMRQARNEQAAVIYANMRCSARDYPLGMALSDVELYYRAGTFASGLIKVTENISSATADAKALKDSTTPAQPVGAMARLDANAANAMTKMQGSRSSCLRLASGGGPVVVPPVVVRPPVPPPPVVVRPAPPPPVVVTPGPTSPPPPASGRVGPFEARMSQKDMQRALDIVGCPGKDFGPAGSMSRQALAKFLMENGRQASDRITDEVFFDLREIKAAGKQGTCSV
jgi:hypothetical protein